MGTVDEELLPPPPRKVVSNNGDEGLLPPPPKKKIGDSTGTGSLTGLGSIPTFDQQTGNTTPLSPQGHDDLATHNKQIQDENEARVKEANDKFSKVYKQLDPKTRETIEKVNALANTKPADNLREPSQEELSHAEFMEKHPVLRALNYMGSEASHGTLQVLKGAAHEWNKSLGSPSADIANDLIFDKADKGADLGLTKTDIAKSEENKPTAALGMLANFAPAVAGGEALNAPKALMFLQGVGQGKELADKLDLNPNAKEALIQGSGAVNLLLSDIGSEYFGKAPSALKTDLVTGVTAEAIKESAGKELTAKSFQELLANKAATVAQKLEKAPLATLEHYTNTAKTLLKVDVGNFAVHKAVDTLNDKPVFNETTGDLAQTLDKSITQDAPMLAAIPMAGELTKLTPFSGYKNDVIQHLVEKPDDAEAVKSQLRDHAQNNGWTPEETQATLAHVDKIAQASKSLPDIAPEKKAKGIELVIGRNDLQKKLSDIQEQKKTLDPAVADLPSKPEEYLTDKIDQANDKLRTLVTGKRTFYSNPEEGVYLKTTDGKAEKITENRYKLENLERTSKQQQNENNENAQKGQQEKTVGEINEKGQENDGHEKSGEVKGTGGEAAAEPVIKEKEKEWDDIPGVKNFRDRFKERLKNPGEYKDWEVEQAKKFLINPIEFYKNVRDYDVQALERNPSDEYYTKSVKENNDIIKKLQEIEDKYAIEKGDIEQNGVKEHQGTPQGEDIQKNSEQVRKEESGQAGGSNSVEPKEEKPRFKIKGDVVTPLPPAEHEEANKLLKELHGITIKDIEDEQQERNGGSEAATATDADEKGLQQPENDGTGNAGKTPAGKAAQGEESPSATGIRNADVEKGGDTDVKKTILTKRAYEGTISDDVKKYLEEKGLTRKSFSQEERSKQATDFINKFGEDVAFHAVNSGDIDGGMAASILAQLQIKNSRAMADFPVDSEERKDLAKKQADLISLMEKKGYLGGEFNGQLAHEYENAELDYANVKKQVEKLTEKPLTEAQDKNIKNITSENEKLKKQLQDAESKLIDETDKAFKAGEEAAKNETKTEKAKRIADKLRKNAKLSKPGIFSSATPASLVWDTAIEITAKSIEAGGKIADAVESGLNHIKGTDWYKSLSANKKTLAEKEFKRATNDKSGTTDLTDLQERFVDKTDNKFTPSEARDIWGYMKSTYLENGVSFRDGLSKTANDLGLSWRQVSDAITTPKTQRISDEMWKKQADYARNRSAIKNWIGDQSKSAAGKLLQNISGKFRGLAVFGHGGIFIGTHAGMTLFNPALWNKTIPAFFRGWKFAYGNEAAYERSMEELQNSPNFIIAERAGLKNNPERMNAEEYQKSQKYLGKLGLAGERGFNAIKVLRQDLFDYHFNKLTPAERDDPAVAKSIAHLVNLATGATNINIPKWVNEVSFAGGMEASRWEKLTASPAKATQVALNALFNPSKASTADRVFAKVWARRVGEQLATYTGLLLANAAIQNTLHPKNPVNYTNPNAPDFLKFKFGDMTIDATSGMRSTAMFMYTLGKIPFESKKELYGEKRISALGKNVAGYARGKLAPLYGTGADFFTGTDFSGNVMPYSKDKPAKGKHKLNWVEYGSSKLPLPIAEAFTVYYKSALEHGANKSTLDNVINGIMSGAISGSTGFRVGEYDEKDAKKNRMKKVK